MNNKYKILLVEDDDNIRALISTMMESAGYQLIETRTCVAALTMAVSYIPDLIILDLGLPDMDGMNVIKAVRESSLVPVIVLSARTGERDKIAALDMGANDYVTKPFSPGEFMARVRSALRFRCHSSGTEHFPDGKFQLRDLTIEFDSRRIFMGETEVKLTQTEFNILALLAEFSGKILTYSAIIKAIWGTPTDGSVKKLQVNMANIRKKLGITPGENQYIVNELGVGYRMNVD